MSRMIPKVRKWRVRHHVYVNGGFGPLKHVDVFVDTVNKRFAKWLAFYRFLDQYGADKWLHEVAHVTVSLARKA